MDSMNISLPRPLKAFVEQQVAAGRYGTASEYLRELIREDEKTKAREGLETLLLEGLASDESSWSVADLEDVRDDAHLNR